MRVRNNNAAADGLCSIAEHGRYGTVRPPVGCLSATDAVCFNESSMSMPGGGGEVGLGDVTEAAVDGYEAPLSKATVKSQGHVKEARNALITSK